jgi:hypothetical protein
MTYSEYVLQCNKQGFQPLGEVAFNAMLKAGFNFQSRNFKE